MKPSGTLYVIATPIGNLEDISARAKRILSEVSLLACEDTRTGRKLLGLLNIPGKEIVSVHDFNERSTVVRLLHRLTQGENAAICSDAGTPCLSDPGVFLVQACLQAGCPVVPVPGPSAIAAALSASGMPADEFLFLGFLPRQGKERQSKLSEIARSTRTVAFFESPQRIQQTLKDFVELLAADRPITLAREITKMHEEIRCLPLGEWLKNPPKELGEYTVIVSPTAEAERQVQLQERYRFYKANSPLSQAEIFKILALEFDINPKRLAYLARDGVFE
jgi:16S rRNA (cytidine1402-2'-O)-methyltransferase